MGYSSLASSAVGGGPHDAVGKDRLDVRTSEVHWCLPGTRGELQPPVPRLWGQPEDRLQMGASLLRRWSVGATGAFASAALAPQCGRIRDRGGDRCDPTSPSA